MVIDETNTPVHVEQEIYRHRDYRFFVITNPAWESVTFLIKKGKKNWVFKTWAEAKAWWNGNVAASKPPEPQGEGKRARQTRLLDEELEANWALEAKRREGALQAGFAAMRHFELDK